MNLTTQTKGMLVWSKMQIRENVLYTLKQLSDRVQLCMSQVSDERSESKSREAAFTIPKLHPE